MNRGISTTMNRRKKEKKTRNGKEKHDETIKLHEKKRKKSDST